MREAFPLTCNLVGPMDHLREALLHHQRLKDGDVLLRRGELLRDLLEVVGSFPGLQRRHGTQWAATPRQAHQMVPKRSGRTSKSLKISL